MLRTIILFIHVIAAMGIFAGLGIEGVALAHLGGATDSDGVKRSIAIFRRAQKTAGPSMGLTVLSGLYLAGAYWGWRVGWVNVALVSVLVVGALFGSMTGRVIGRIDPSAPVASLAARRVTLRNSFQMRIALLAGIVYLMTNKLELMPSILVMVIALLIGLVADFATARRRSEVPAERPVSH